ncbi:hypothetical protein ACB098_05G178600 [Castanea mollissima]
MANSTVIDDVRNCVIKESCRTLLVVEVYVLSTTLLIAFLTIFGSWRRRSHSLTLKYLIWASYILPPDLARYTMGMAGEFAESLSAIWATFLVITLGSADCVSAYRLADSECRKEYNFQLLVLYCWLGWQLGRSSSSLETSFAVLISVLFALSLFKTVARSKAWTMASSYGLVRNTKLIADFMEDEDKEDVGADLTCMKGYKYLVKGGKAEKKVKAPRYHMQLKTADDEVITIDKIWQCKGRLLSSTGDPDGRLKDICLSYALYRLLCRRFAGYPFSESSQQKTWNFVRYGLLSEEDDGHKRAFRVIEVELAFLHDLFYTTYPVFFANGLLWLRNLELVVVIIGCWIVVSILVSFCTQKEHLTSYEIPTVLTIIAIGATLLVEVGQIFVINFSDWAKVQWLCYYVKKPSLQNNKFIEMIIQILCHRKALKPWDRKLGQYSLLESFNHNPCKILHNPLTSLLIDINKKGRKLSAQITLPVEVKKAVIHSLKTNEQQLRNGVASLQRNEVQDKLSWACRLETQSHVIMVWHIATSFCELNLSSQVIATREQSNQRRESNEFIVATELSKYCAYLVAFAPRLLPGHAYTTEFIFDQVVVEARDKLKGCKKSIYQKMLTCKDDCMKRICEEMLTLGKDDPAEAEEIIERGATLAKQIEQIEDNGLKWKILSEFWAEMMLFVASSGDETAHAEHLAMGGEFVTHLWALLSHAGILMRDSTQDV